MNVQCLKLFRNRVRLVDSRQTFARPLRDRTSASHEAFPVMIDAIASSLGSMIVGYECSFPAQMDKQLMEVAIALHAAPASVTRNARGMRHGFSHFEQSRNTVANRTCEPGRARASCWVIGKIRRFSRWAKRLGLHHQTVQRCVKRAVAEGPMAAPDDRPRPGREPTITLEAKAWLTSLSCRKAKELGYPHELWTTRLLTPHAREHGPAEGHPCLANTKMAVARVAAPDWSYAGSRGGGANPRHRASGCRRHTVGLRYRACASAGHRNREHRQPQG